MNFKNISPELREKAKSCTSIEEVLTLAKREGYKLSDADMEAVSGDGWSYFTGPSPYESDKGGDVREGIDPSQVDPAYVEGRLDPRDLDW